MAVLAGIVPTHAVIAERIPGRAYGERQLVGAHRMAGVCPYLAARMRRRQWINRQVQNARDFRRTLLAVDAISDRDLLHSEVLADQRRERRHGPAGSAGKDRAQRLGLLVVGALIDIGAPRPVPVCHGPGLMAGGSHIRASSGMPPYLPL